MPGERESAPVEPVARCLDDRSGDEGRDAVRKPSPQERPCGRLSLRGARVRRSGVRAGCRGRLRPGDGGAWRACARLRAQRRPAERRWHGRRPAAGDAAVGGSGAGATTAPGRRRIGLEKRRAGGGIRVPSVRNGAQDNERPDEGGAPRPQDRRHHPIHRASPISAETHDRATSKGCQRPGVRTARNEGCAAAGSLPRPHVPRRATSPGLPRRTAARPRSPSHPASCG